MFSSPSYSGWTRVTENVDGVTFYVDLERIRKVDGFVYFWYLADYLKLNKHGEFSETTYVQSDCKLFRYKKLSGYFHKKPMGRGSKVTGTTSSKWDYPPPKSSVEIILDEVCSR